MPKNSRKSSSQPPFSSTPRRHLRGSPVAHRTRRQISFVMAVQIGLCKICYRVLPDMQSLWDHIKSAHSPSAKQQCCLNSFPTEFHFDANLAKANAWEIFFGTTSCPQIKHSGSPVHGSEPVLNTSDQSCPMNKQCVLPDHSSEPDINTFDQSFDSVEKGLLTSFSQPTASVPDVSVVPSSDRCEPDQAGCQTVDAGSTIPSGLSHSWCAPIPVYTNPSAQLKGPEHSKSLPLNLISVQCDSPIWPQVENLPTVHTVCEIQAKTRSPPQPKSPDILEIVLGGDISLPESPDFVQLREAWLGKLNGSPPHPAFPPPSFAQVVAKKTIPTKNVLLPCNKCDRRFYTTHGLNAHVCKNQMTEGPGAPSKELISSGPPSKPKRPREPLPPRLRKKSVKTQSNAQVVCLFCEKPFKTLAALSQHSFVVHGELRNNVWAPHQLVLLRQPLTNSVLFCQIKLTPNPLHCSSVLNVDLTSYHRRPNLAVQYWCLSCQKRIVQPARHQCLKGASLFIRSSQGAWECEDCQFKASTKVGLDNHQKAHRREAAVLELPQLVIPEPSSKRAKKKKARLAPLSSGDPGVARLAPPAIPLAIDPPAPEQNEDLVEGRADLAVPTF
ncbi:hypothetical protein TNCT_89151 [Trichonephila clavata]|uniref:C2H2-type domain-containing protein n=1 Tax=Trichonephila clavata TaxID=2740835 RepID=A0A8X6ICQ3_TRICU|nr:hypothetical protein TNCT_89151 [Trichonephila clavata]